MLRNPTFLSLRLLFRCPALAVRCVPSSQHQQVYPVLPYAPPALLQGVQIELEPATVDGDFAYVLVSEGIRTTGRRAEGSVGSLKVRFTLSMADGAYGVSWGRACCFIVGFVWTRSIHIYTDSNCVPLLLTRADAEEICETTSMPSSEHPDP